MSKTSNTIAAGVLVAHLDAANQSAELKSISTALQNLQNTQASEAARRVAIEQAREQVVNLRARQTEASRALEASNPEAVNAAAYLILDIKETLGALPTSVFPEIQDKEYLRALQSDNAVLVAKLEGMLGSARIQELVGQVVAGNIYGDVAAYTCASGTIAKNSTPPLSWLFWWNSGRRALMRGTRLLLADGMTKGHNPLLVLLGPTIIIIGTFIIQSLLVAVILLLPFVLLANILIETLVRTGAYSSKWAADDAVADVITPLFVMLIILLPIAVAVASAVYRFIRGNSIREWAKQCDIDADLWLDSIQRAKRKELLKELRAMQPDLTAKLARIGIAWPSDLKHGTQNEVNFLTGTRVMVKKLAGYE